VGPCTRNIIAKLLLLGLLTAPAFADNGSGEGSGITPGQPWIDTGTDLETLPDRDVVIIDATPTLELRDSTTDSADFEWWADNDVVYLSDRENSRQILYYVAPNNRLYIPSLVSCDTIDTSAEGQLTCGTDASAAFNSFETLSVPAGTNPVADSATDTLTLTETAGLDISGTAGTDTINIAVDLTEVSTLTLGAGAFTTLTFDSGATDPTMTAGNGTLTLTPGGSDLIVEDDLEVQDPTPHVRLTDTSADSDDFEWWADNNVVYLGNVTQGVQHLYFHRPNNALYLPALASCDTIDTTAEGKLQCGSDSGGVGGSNTQVQYNNAGSLAGTAGLTVNATTITDLTFATDAIASSDLLTGLSDETGSGVAVFATSPTLTTPTLGEATATTLDTGQGANELYAMDQAVRTTDSPTFANAILAGTGPDLRWNPTSGDSFHAGAEYAASSGSLWFLSNVTDGQHYLRVRNDHLFEFPQYQSCSFLSTGADGRVSCESTLSVSDGGTGLTAVPTNGQLYIGDGAGAPTLATLTAGTNITVTNGAGSITIAAAGGDVGGTNSSLVQRTAGDVTTTSSTLADMTGLSITITTAANPVEVCFTGVVDSTVAGDDVVFNVEIDDTTLVNGTGGLWRDALGDRSNASHCLRTDALTAASHKFDMQFARAAGTGTVKVDCDSAVPCNFFVKEVVD